MSCLGSDIMATSDLARPYAILHWPRPSTSYYNCTPDSGGSTWCSYVLYQGDSCDNLRAVSVSTARDFSAPASHTQQTIPPLVDARVIESNCSQYTQYVQTAPSTNQIGGLWTGIGIIVFVWLFSWRVFLRPFAFRARR